MRALFVDTAGWMALADANDPAHVAALRARDSHLEQGGLVVSTDFVLDETLTLLRVRLGIEAAARWWDQVESTSLLRWEWIDAERAERARRWFFGWGDKAFSFTDCTSFAVMRELGIRAALTTDRDFLQAGFEIVPRGGRSP